MPRQILDQTSDAVIAADKDGVIIYWNRSAGRMFGYPSGEAEGRTLDLIIPEKHRRRHWAGYRRVMRTGETAYGDRTLKVPSFTRDGKHLLLEFSMTLIREQDGSVKAAVAIIRPAEEKSCKEVKD